MQTRDLVLISLFAAIIVALGFVPPITLGFIPVPITAQSLGVMLAGVILGAKRGALAAVLVILLVAIGLPVLSGGRGGLAVFAGPTVGFGLIKRALQASEGNDFESQLALEAESQRIAFNTHDTMEGIAAFLQKRKPAFTGA